MDMEKYVPIPHNIMGNHTGNVYYDVVRNDLVLLFLFKIQINIQQTRVQK